MNSILPVKSRRFIKLYIRDTAALRGVRNYELLFEMFKQVNFFGEIHLNSYLKNQMAKTLELSNSRLDHLLIEYKKKDLIKSLGDKRGSGSYMLNPNYFFKGSEPSQRMCCKFYENITKITRNTVYTEGQTVEVSTIEYMDAETGEIMTLKNEEIFGVCNDKE